MAVLERFIRYARIHTQSDRETGLTPSTPGQLEFAYLLREEMEEIGMQDVSVDDNGYVMGFLPSNAGKEAVSIGFIAHLDTSPDTSGRNVKPRVIKQYRGEEIILNEEKGHVLSPAIFPELARYAGSDLVVTDGNTLLGADDKAGIAEILEAMDYLARNPGIKHGRIAVCFTPDEEIGEGPDHFDVKRFGATFAYTIDGGELGELEYENFNAASVKLTFKGRNFHPGYAKDKMVNSLKVAREFMESLPEKDAPERTSGHEGFFHPFAIKGGVEETVLEMFIRDFDKEAFEQRKSMVEKIARELSGKHDLPVEVETRDQYYNMKEKLEPLHHVIDIAKQAMLEVGVEPLIVPIRGGTNGSRLSFMGLPTPNIGNGCHNSHGRYEYIPVPSMEKAVALIVRVCELCAALDAGTTTRG
ncbi:MAG: peptidase T [Odoribacteraceae bacterium]|jgi:tripeptide aminopeptidase|nr:peptidase T [Odoribacteraceae bacterium]